MNFEERLERLVERHEALAGNVEFMQGLMLRSEEQLARNEEQLAKVIAAIHQDAENIRSLARIAEAHERRLDRLES